MCQSNKRPYLDEDTAKTAIAGPLKRHGKRFTSYKCPFCSFWHVKTVVKKATVRRSILKRAVKNYIKLTAGASET